MSVVELLTIGVALLVILPLLLHSIHTLIYALSDRPIIEERLRRFAGEKDI